MLVGAHYTQRYTYSNLVSTPKGNGISSSKGNGINNNKMELLKGMDYNNRRWHLGIEYQPISTIRQATKQSRE
jgi:hypothetical protein